MGKTGVCMGIPIFLIFAPKHRLWVLVRTASPKKKSAKIFQFLKLKNSLYNAWTSFRNVNAVLRHSMTKTRLVVFMIVIISIRGLSIQRSSGI